MTWDGGRAGWWDSQSLRGKTLVAFALPVLALLIAVTAIVVERHDTQAATTQAEQALQSQISLQRVLRYVTSAESSLRGYLATDEIDLLERHNDAVARLPAVVTDLGRQVSTDTGQRERFLRLRAHLSEEVSALGSLESGSLGQGRPRTKAMRDSEVRLSDIGTIAASMELHARQLHRTYTMTVERASARSTAVTIGAVGLAVLGGLVALRILFSGLIRRLELVRDDARRLAAGEPLHRTFSGHDEIAQVAQTLQQTALILADKESLLELSIEAGGLILFEADPGGEVRLRGDPDLLSSVDLETEPNRTTLARVQRALIKGGHPGYDKSFQGDVSIRTVDGGIRRLEIRARDVLDENGRPTGVRVGVASDVTARVVTQEALEAAKEKAELANRTKDEFLSRVSHELRTPLNAVLGFAQLLEMDRLSPGQSESVKHILEGGQHLLALVNDMLDLARIESGHLTLVLQPVHVRNVVSEAVQLMAPIAALSDVTIRIDDAHPVDLSAQADRRRTLQIVLNLLSNAVKYNKPAGSVVITLGATAHGNVSLSVADTGAGIAETHRSALFAPFARLDAQDTGIEGTGLGLSLSRRLAEAMGGRLELSATGPEGSRFTAYLPAAVFPLEPDESAAAKDTTTIPDLSGVSVLHIEDHKVNVRLVDDLLSRTGAPKPLTADCGRTGLRLAADHRLDLILLDLHLRDMPGGDVLIALKANPATTEIPVVVLSANTVNGSARMRELGAAATVAKPIDIASFWQAIDMALTGGPSA